MHNASTLIATPLLVWALCAAPAQAAEHEGAATLQSEPESVWPGSICPRLHPRSGAPPASNT